MDIEKLKSNFLSAFNLEGNGFYKPVFLSDVKVGFGALRDLDSKIKEKLNIIEGKEYKTLLHIYIKDEDLDNEKIQKKPLVIKAHFNLSSGEDLFREQFDFIKKHRYQPVDLVSRDYFYDTEKNIFYNNKGDIISAEQILAQIYNLHIKTSKLFLGFYLRIKLFFWRSLLPFFFKCVYQLFVGILYIISGEKCTYDIIKNYVDTLYFKNTEEHTKREPKLNLTENKKITIFGYSASPWAICAYCVFHFLIYTIMYLLKYKPDYIKYLLTNNFAIIIYVIPTLSFFEAILPKIIKYFIKQFTLLAFNFSAKEIKI